MSEELVIDVLSCLKPTPKKHVPCCGICKPGTAHFINDDENELIHVVSKDGNDFFINKHDYGSMMDLLKKVEKKP